MRFGDPVWLRVLYLLPLAVFLYWLGIRAKNLALELWADPSLARRFLAGVGRSWEWFGIGIRLAVFALILLALARPQWGTLESRVSRRGLDIVICLDTSASMRAADFKPDRLSKAKREIRSFLDRLGGDRVGIVTFAGSAQVRLPLTLDYRAAGVFLDVVETESGGQRPGTAIADAIRMATRLFDPKLELGKAIFLVTDGEDHRSDPQAAAREAAAAGVRIYALGLGTPEGDLVPEFDENGRRAGYKKDRDGRPVLSKLDEVTLSSLASVSGGLYARATPSEKELGVFLASIDQLTRGQLGEAERVRYQERFVVFLAPALFLLVLELFFVPKKRVGYEI